MDPPKTAAQIKRARVKTRVKVRRWRHRRAKQAAEAKTFVKRSIEGSAARARPHCAGGRNFTAPPRWPLLLDIMADGPERTMRELCAAFDRPHSTTSTTLQRRLIARGFAGGARPERPARRSDTRPPNHLALSHHRGGLGIPRQRRTDRRRAVMTDLSPQQQEAVTAIRRWRAAPNGKSVFRLHGYAGAGKTRTANEAARGASAHFCAPTGKAALRLQQKECAGATTIHKALYAYTPDPTPQERRVFQSTKKWPDTMAWRRAIDTEGLAARADLVVVDNPRWSTTPSPGT